MLRQPDAARVREAIDSFRRLLPGGPSVTGPELLETLIALLADDGPLRHLMPEDAARARPELVQAKLRDVRDEISSFLQSARRPRDLLVLTSQVRKAIDELVIDSASTRSDRP